MKNVYNRFGKNREIYAIGISYGANNIANILGYEGDSSFITAAVSFQPIIDMNKWPEHMRKSGLGIYDFSIGAKINLSVCNKPNTEMMKDTVFLKTGLNSEIAPFPKTALGWMATIVAPLEDYKGTEEYCRAASIHQRIPLIKVPCLFICALDDPIVGSETIDYRVFRENENCVLTTTKYGGHIGYYESITGDSQWFINPVFAYFDSF